MLETSELRKYGFKKIPSGVDTDLQGHRKENAQKKRKHMGVDRKEPANQSKSHCHQEMILVCNQGQQKRDGC